jgi:hypothetical protein
VTLTKEEKEEFRRDYRMNKMTTHPENPVILSKNE